MAFAEPDQILKSVDIDPSLSVADFGSGGGAFARAAAKLVPSGKVYAVDINKDMLSKLKADAAAARIGNIETIWADIEAKNGTKLGRDTVRLVILSNVMFLTENKEAVAEEALRILSPGGLILVVDWTDSFGGLGPVPASIFNKRDAMELFQKHGCALSKEISAGDHHYALLFRSPQNPVRDKSSAGMYYTYVLKSKKSGRWYTGSTEDLRKRLSQHNGNKSNYTKKYTPYELIYYEACKNREDSQVREKYLKSTMGKRFIKNRLKRFLSLTG